jgi:hypothetical protein
VKTAVGGTGKVGDVFYYFANQYREHYLTNVIVTIHMVLTITGNPIATLAGASNSTIKGTYTITQGYQVK